MADSATLPRVSVATPTFRRWCWNPGGTEAGWVEVAEAVPCDFPDFHDFEFFSHRWIEGLFSVAEASTGYGVDGVLDPKRAYETRGAAIDAAETELRRIGRPAFQAAIEAVVAGRSNRG